MSHRGDPIEILRDVFDSITPTPAQGTAWLERMRTAQRMVSQPELPVASPGSEPLPWRLLIGSGIAAGLTLATWLAGPLSPLSGEDKWVSARARVDRAISMAEPPLQQPTDSGMMWHIPATGLDLRMLDSFTDIISAPFATDQGMAGT